MAANNDDVGWVLTDDDTWQWRRQSERSPMAFELVQAFGPVPPRGTWGVYADHVDLRDYTTEELEDMAAGYYDRHEGSALDALAEGYGASYGSAGYPYGVLAEIVFETELATYCAEYPRPYRSFEEAYQGVEALKEELDRAGHDDPIDWQR